MRASLERLALVAYQNTAFYNPATQQPGRVTLHFFSSYLPTRGRGGEVDPQRAWRIGWSPMFFQMCQATGDTLLLDLGLYRELTPAARRLFLKLKDRFWRSKQVFMNVYDLTIHGLGFSADRPLKKRKFDLTACIRELLQHGIIELGRGQTDPKQLCLKRGKGVYVVRFSEGTYFRRPLAERTQALTCYGLHRKWNGRTMTWDFATTSQRYGSPGHRPGLPSTTIAPSPNGAALSVLECSHSKTDFEISSGARHSDVPLGRKRRTCYG